MNEDLLFDDFQTYYTDIPDCIISIDDYKELIENLFKLNENQLVLKQFSSSDNEIILNINDEKYTIEVEDSEYFDFSLLNRLNEIIQKKLPKEKRTFIDISGIKADFAIGFATKEKEIELFKNEHIWRNDDWIKENIISENNNDERPEFEELKKIIIKNSQEKTKKGIVVHFHENKNLKDSELEKLKELNEVYAIINEVSGYMIYINTNKS